MKKNQLDRLETARIRVLKAFNKTADTGEVHAVLSLVVAEIALAAGVPKEQWLEALGKTYDIVRGRLQ